MIRLVKSNRETQYIVLTAIASMASERKGMFEPYLKCVLFLRVHLVLRLTQFNCLLNVVCLLLWALIPSQSSTSAMHWPATFSSLPFKPLPQKHPLFLTCFSRTFCFCLCLLRFKISLRHSLLFLLPSYCLTVPSLPSHCLFVPPSHCLTVSPLSPSHPSLTVSPALAFQVAVRARR